MIYNKFVVRMGLCLLLPLASASWAAASPAAAAPEIERFLAPYFTSDAPGATVIVTHDGKPIFRKAYGLANVEDKTPMQPDMVLRIGSITKQFTAVAIMLLADQGKLRLDDDITKHLPAYPKPKKKITIDHLLTHTSGIPSYTAFPDFLDNQAKDYTVNEMIDRFKDKPLEFSPGTKMRYSNSGYYLLGAIIERHSGISYADFIAKNIFEPLGMKDTALEGSERSGKKLIPGYVGRDKIDRAKPLSATQPYAAGSIVSTVDDLAIWDAAIAEGKLLKPESWKKLFTPINTPTGNASKIARGWFTTDVRGRDARWHSGGIDGFLSNGIRLPGEKLYVAILANTGSPRVDPTALSKHLVAFILGKPYSFAGVETPFYLRGSMNKWGATQRMQASGANKSEFVTELALPAGEHEFKFGSKDWSVVDFGSSGQQPQAVVGSEMALFAFGANFKLDVAEKGRYRFVLNASDALLPTARIEKVSAKRGT